MSLGRIAGGALVATALAATMCVGTIWTARAMETDLTDQARSTLDAQHLSATVVFDGRDAYVWADTATTRADAIAALRTIPGVRVVLMGEGTPPVTPQAGPSVAVGSAALPPTMTPTGESTSPPAAPADPSGSALAAGSQSLATTPAPTPTTTLASSAVTSAVPTASAPTTTTPVVIPAWPAIHFDGDSATVAASSKTEIAQIAQLMAAQPNVTVLLTGYTDSAGTAAGRQALGLTRANAVKTVLLTRGVSPSRIMVASGGGTNPVASSDTSQGRALNRRVTVTMTQES